MSGRGFKTDMGPTGGDRRPPAFSPQTLTALYLRGAHDALSESLLSILGHFRDVTYARLDPQGLAFVNAFAQHFLHLFTQADYRLSRPDAFAFVRLGATVSNLVALSAFGTTEPFLRLLEGAPEPDLAKRLTLLSARNPTAPDRRAYFDADPALASAWFGAYGETYASGLVRPEVMANLCAHFRYDDDRLDVRQFALDAYFASTYAGGDCDRVIKGALNRAVRRAAVERGWALRPGRAAPRSVAVLSGNWHPEHSVYRITSAYVEALKAAGYRLTFVRLGRKPNADLAPFDEVRQVTFDSAGVLDLEPLRDRDWAAAVFPDVGLTPHSIALANLRVSPVQVALLGHSVSTFGALIDYFVSGDGVEAGPDPGRHYSERLVLLSGWGAVHDLPRGLPGVVPGAPDPNGPVLINAPWNAQKVSHELALTLRQVVSRASRPVRLRVFASASLNRRNDLPVFARDLGALLGPGSVEVVPALPYADYMARMNEGAFTLDSFPFGGCNTVADSLSLRKLAVCREGDRWYNRIGPATLRAAGLPELACGTESAYVETSLRLIGDDAYSAALQARLDRADPAATVFNRAEAAAFPAVLDYLIAHHDRLQAERPPGAGMAPLRFDTAGRPAHET